MSVPTRGIFRLVLAGVLAVVLSTLVARAQDGRIDVAWKDRTQEENILMKVRNGEIPWETKTHGPMAERLARYMVYRLTWPENQIKSVQGFHTTAGTSINDLYLFYDRYLPDYRRGQVAKDPDKADRAKRQRKWVEELTQQLVPCIDKVLKHNSTMARINAARMLARLAEYGSEELCDSLAAVMEDNSQIDAVKLWAAIGMHDLYSNLPERIRKEDKEVRIIQAAVAFIQRPSPLPPDAPAEEVKAFHYVRRAFVAALGSGYRPALVQNRNQIVGRPALELVRVVSKDGLNPPPSLSEQVEAVVGLGNLQKRWFADYQADYAAYHIGFFLIDFFAAYNAERQILNPIKTEPWKIHAMRLKEALQKMVADSKNAYVRDVQGRADGLLDLVVQSQTVSVNPFSDWLRANPPPSPSLYKGDAKAVVKLPKLES